MIATVLGFLGAVLLASCAMPLLHRTVRDGHARGVDGTFIALWLAGEVTMVAHVLLAGTTLPVLANYLANVLLVGVVGWYRWVK